MRRVLLARRRGEEWPEVAEVEAADVNADPTWAAGVALAADGERLACHLALAGHTGQVLLTEGAAGLLGRGLERGTYRLADLGPPRIVHEVTVDDAPGPAPRALRDYSTNLSPPSAPLVGRRRELAELRAALVMGSTIAVVGPPGVGKTRLALHAAGDLLPLLPGGAWFVDLAGVPVDADVAAAVGIAIPADPPGPHLVLLDNCEHVALAAGRAAQALVAERTVVILATSRTHLGVGERVWPLAPLDEDDAVAMFLERARLVAPFRDVASDATAVRALCDRLDHLPLGIELAAARTRVLSPSEIGERLAAGPEVLETNDDTRHRSLTQALRSSYDLLGPDAQAALRFLSVFAATFTLGAASVVIGADALGPITELVDASLVAVADSGEVTRYRLLDTVRAFARERLTAAESDCAYERLLAWAPTATPAVKNLSPAQVGDDYDNVVAAVTWALVHRPEDALDLLGATWSFWYFAGRSSEGRRWLDRGLAAAPLAHDSIRARALNAAANLGVAVGDYAAAEQAYNESLALRRDLGDQRGVANVIGDLGVLADRAGDTALARSRYQEAFDRYVAVGDQFGQAATLTNLGDLERRAGEVERARPLLERAVDLWDGVSEVNRFAALAALGVARRDRAMLAGAMAALADHDAATTFVDALASAVELAWDDGDGRGALYLLGAGDALRRATADALSATVAAGLLQIKEQALRKVQHADEAYAAGKASTTEEIVAVVRGAPIPTLTEAPEWVREDRTWRLRFAGRVVHLADSKGLAYLAELVARPRVPVPVLDLVAAVEGAVVVERDVGPDLDDTARAAYARRIRELRAAADAAKERDDERAAASAEAELDALIGELNRAVGIGGRARPRGASSERARKATTNRIRDAIRKIGEVHPELAAHLDVSVRTGGAPVYEPPDELRWVTNSAR